MVVHFPIALLLLAALCEFLPLRGRREQLAFTARFSLWVGALSALAAASLGWIDALGVGDSYVGFSAGVLSAHRWVGTATAAAAGFALLAGERFQRTARRSWRRGYRLSLLVVVLLVGATAHLGGSLIYGWDYLTR